MENSPSRLGHFILVRLWASGQPPSRSVLDRTLRPYFVSRLSLTDGQWRQLLEKTLEELAIGGWIQTQPYRLSTSGRGECRQFLQWEQTPTGSKWMTLRNRPLMARALKIQPQSPAEWDRLASADGLRAAVLVKHYRLAIDPLPTLPKALDALAEHAQSTTPPPKAGSLMRDDLLRETLIPNQTGELKIRLPAFVTKAQNTSMEALRRAVINRWLNGCDAKDYEILRIAERRPARETEQGIAAFALQVQELARHLEAGQFGGNKVFLSHLWKNYREQTGQVGMSREQFDRQLLEANRLNLITLSRADLVSAMNPADVEASEIALPHATFHFIRTDS